MQIERKHHKEFFKVLMVLGFSALGLLGPSALVQVQAQEVVEVETDLIEIESDISIEDLLEQEQKEMALKAEIKTSMERGGEAPEVMGGENDVPEADPPEKMDDEEVAPMIDQKLISTQQDAVKADVIREEEVVRINKSLRRAIEQNRRLQDEKKKMQEELGSLRGESRMSATRRQALVNQVEKYEEQIKKAVEVQQNLTQTVDELQGKIKSREDILLGRINELQNQLENGIEQKQGEMAAVMDGSGLKSSDVAAITKVAQAQETGLDVIQLVDDLDKMRQKMREDEARVHYNMGNIFFHQGKHQEAAQEFEKALEIAPDDANAHFNLAYVSGDFLSEYAKAVEHYQQYLFLTPAAEDKNLVQEKILEAQMYLRAWQDKNVDHDVRDDRTHGLYDW